MPTIETDHASDMRTLFCDKYKDYFFTTEKVGISLRFLFYYNLMHFFLKRIEFEHVFEFITSLQLTSSRVYLNEYDANDPNLYEKYKINSVEKNENIMKAQSKYQDFRVKKIDDLNYDFEISTQSSATLSGQIEISIDDESQMYDVQIHASYNWFY
jgi:hypothetical protein